MSDSNPYQPPSSSPAPAAPIAAVSAISDTGRAVDAGRGWEWIAEGFALFKKQPGIWILVLIIFIACAAVIHIVPGSSKIPAIWSCSAC